MENDPGISFTSASPLQCWEMVRERLNQEIVRQQNLGKNGLPELQTIESMDGLAMFGFLSPSIVHVSLTPLYPEPLPFVFVLLSSASISPNLIKIYHNLP